MSYVTRTYACATYGRLAFPYNVITAYETSIYVIKQYGQEGLNSSVPLTHTI